MLFNKQLILNGFNYKNSITRSFNISSQSIQIFSSPCVQFGSNLHGFVSIIYQFYIFEAPSDKKKNHGGLYFIEATRSISGFPYSEMLA